MAFDEVKVACIGMGWWSDVLADAIGRSGKLKITACYTRSAEKRAVFAAKYACRAAPSYESILEDRSIEAIINTTPNTVHLETTRAAETGIAIHVSGASRRPRSPRSATCATTRPKTPHFISSAAQRVLALLSVNSALAFA